MFSRLSRLLGLSALAVFSLASSADAQTRVSPKAPRLQRAAPPSFRPSVPLVRINTARLQPRLTSLTTVVNAKGKLESAGEGGFQAADDDVPIPPPNDDRPPPTDRGGEDPPPDDPPDDDRPPPTDRGGEDPPPTDRGGDDGAADGSAEGGDNGDAAAVPNVLGATAEQLRQALAGSNLSTAETGTFNSVAQVEVGAVLTRTAWGGVGETVQPALISGGNDDAKDEARVLLKHVEGLLLEPHRVRDAVVAFNDFVEASSGDFLSSPPEEFEILYATLAALTDAAYEELAAIDARSSTP